MTDDRPATLIFSAHAADFAWRAGGAIASYASLRAKLKEVGVEYVDNPATTVSLPRA